MDKDLIVFSAFIALVMALIGTGAYGEPPWVSVTYYINGATGDDSNGGTNPGGDAVKTWDRALELVGSDSHARVIWAGRVDKTISDTPSINQADNYLFILADRGRQEYSQSVIPGHPEFPSDVVDTSSVGGVGISRRYVYETFLNIYGKEQERLIDVVPTVVTEDYDPVP